MHRPSMAPELAADISELALAVLEKAQLGVVITDTELDEPSPRILFANPAFCRMSGYSLAELLGGSTRKLQGPLTSRAVLDRLRAALASREDFEGETWNYRADGTPFLMQWSISALRSRHDGKEYFFAIQRDVTELRRLEQISEAANLMDNIGYAFAGIRHELGNPINSIKAALSLLQRGAHSYSRERIASNLDGIMEELKRVEYLLSELRTYNSYEGSTVALVDMEAYLQRFVDLVREDCERRGCQIELDIDRRAPRAAFVDRRGLHQVLLNLVTNSMDACLAEGSSEVGTSRIVLALRAGEHATCELVVADNGPGIAPEHVDRVFMPFFTTKPTGTGLGLALVRRILARMAAQIAVHHGDETEGAAFAITLATSPAR